MTKPEYQRGRGPFGLRASGFDIVSSFVIRHSSLSSFVIRHCQLIRHFALEYPPFHLRVKAAPRSPFPRHRRI